jgi:hypothetical protein
MCGGARRARGSPSRAVLEIDLTRGDLLAAGIHVPLGSSDAIHLAVALGVGADEIVRYAGELVERVAGRSFYREAGNLR